MLILATDVCFVYVYVQAANAALINFFETLRTELGSEIGITIVTPGWIESEMSKGKYLKEQGEMEVDQEMRDVRTLLLSIDEICHLAGSWN
jgi:NAD(P)-dependent dehydrogenase (short-subunit alcohol dehydrogenase family)